MILIYCCVPSNKDNVYPVGTYILKVVIETLEQNVETVPS